MTILVTGATGNIGRLVVDHLLAAGETDIRALTVNPVKAALPPEVEVATGYVGRPETLPEVLDGVDRMYLAPVPEAVAEVMTLAKQAGVQHVVDLAGAKDSWWGAVEEAVEASEVAWTHLEPGEFMNNTWLWADQIRTTGQVRDAYPEAANAMVDLDDIAAVAAVALLEDGHVGKAYELTGPETLTRRQLVATISEVLGIDVPYLELSRDEAVAMLEPMMGEYASWYVDGCAELVDTPQLARPEVFEAVTGRPGTTYAQWVAKNAEVFRPAEPGSVGVS